MQKDRNSSLKMIEKEFGIKERKIKSTNMRSYSWLTKGEEPRYGEVFEIAKQAILSAITSPYLRAVCIITESEEGKRVVFVEIKESPLDTNEKVAVLLHSQRKMLAIREERAAYVMDTSQLSKLIFEHIKKVRAKNLHIVNVHHDYIRSFFQEPIPFEELAWKIMDNVHFEEGKVISK